ncbi:MAG: hypothetical protein EOM17_17055, partial [Synergistales bacterium]|nr:hypothetical protein [Synergistales bacterium]
MKTDRPAFARKVSQIDPAERFCSDGAQVSELFRGCRRFPPEVARKVSGKMQGNGVIEGGQPMNEFAESGFIVGQSWNDEMGHFDMNVV